MSQPPTNETSAASYTGTLTFDLVLEILSRVPVKSLIQLKCVCKSWNSLISDPKFAKKHLCLSRTQLNRHHLLSLSRDSESGMLLGDTQLSSFFNSTSSTIIPATLLRYPLYDSGTLIGCCDGILCYYFGSFNDSSVMLWNPSIRKFKILPPLEHQPQLICMIYGFGYDCLTDTYKLVAVRCYEWDSSNMVSKIKVMLHTVGKDTWKTIEGFPSRLQRGMMCSKHGIFVTGAVNWFVRTNSTYSRVILSFDLGNESFKEFSPPDCGEVCGLTLGVLRDCLCILAHTDTLVIHVWLMKDYGNEDSWTKLFTLPYNLLGRQMPGSSYPLYISEHDQLLLELENDIFTLNFEMKFFVYNSRDDTGKTHEVPSILGNNFVCGNTHVYIESLITP